jgi:K(+)-stimulated pyrophosphate-energized sodium pump
MLWVTQPLQLKVLLSLAALTSCFICPYVTFTGIDGINIQSASFGNAFFVGGMIPGFPLEILLGKAAMDMVYEVRRQFREIPNYGRNWKTEYANVWIFLLKLLYAK